MFCSLVYDFLFLILRAKRGEPDDAPLFLFFNVLMFQLCFYVFMFVLLCFGFAFQSTSKMTVSMRMVLIFRKAMVSVCFFILLFPVLMFFVFLFFVFFFLLNGKVICFLFFCVFFVFVFFYCHQNFHSQFVNAQNSTEHSPFRGC